METVNVRHITIYHVLSDKTGEQRHEDADPEKAAARAFEFAAVIVAMGHMVTVWKTFDLREIKPAFKEDTP